MAGTKNLLLWGLQPARGKQGRRAYFPLSANHVRPRHVRRIVVTLLLAGFTLVDTKYLKCLVWSGLGWSGPIRLVLIWSIGLIMSGEIDELIQLLTSELASFDDSISPLLSSQLNAFVSVSKLLKEDGDAPGLSKQRRSEKSRARDLLTDILLVLGAEVFLLCTFALPLTKLSTTKPKDLIPALRAWWTASPQPRGLTTMAATMCQSVSDIISSARKRKFSEIGINGSDIYLIHPHSFADFILRLSGNL